MSEGQLLECLLDICDMQYRRTGDKWYLKASIETAKKIRRDKERRRKNGAGR